MSEETAEKIKKLSQHLKSLREQRAVFDKEAKEWAEKRDAVHKQIKDLKLEAANLRDRRDSINTKVKTLKMERNQKRSLVQRDIEETRQLRERLQRLYAKKPKQAASVIKLEKEKIEWQIQTTSLTLPEEKPLVEKTNRLEKQLNVHLQIDGTKAKIIKLNRKINSMNKEAKQLHAQISELATQSQELHQKMRDSLEKAKALQPGADEHHQNFVQNKQLAKKIHEEIVAIEKEIETVEKALAEDKEKKKTQRLEETRKKLKREALEKLKQGKKLAFEEFKLLAEEETN